jgi:hypothetical protein
MGKMMWRRMKIKEMKILMAMLDRNRLSMSDECILTVPYMSLLFLSTFSMRSNMNQTC